MTNPNAVPLLSRESASYAACPMHVALPERIQNELDAIASGSAVVIPRITREALRRELGVGLRFVPGGDGCWSIGEIIAALKRLGVETGE